MQFKRIDNIDGREDNNQIQTTNQAYYAQQSIANPWNIIGISCKTWNIWNVSEMQNDWLWPFLRINFESST